MTPSTSEISPPPTKRRRLSSRQSSSAAEAPSPPPVPPNAFVDDSSARTLRIYSWNINGIQAFLPSTTPKITSFLAPTSTPKSLPSKPSLRETLFRWGFPDLVFLQEVKVAPLDTKTPALLRRIVNTPLNTEVVILPSDQLYDTHLCLPRDRFNATGFGGKVYGVCALIRQDLSTDVKMKTVEWDLEGRVQVLEIASLGLVVINIYAVNGTTNDYRDPKTGKVIGDRHDRKREFHALLANEVRLYEYKSWNVIVAGDINISRSKFDSFPQQRIGEDHVKNRADFEEKFMNGLGMLDTFRLKRGDERKYSYRPTKKPWGAGGDRVDLILATKKLRESVKEADILDSELERGPSDHVPLLLEVEVHIAVDGKTSRNIEA